MRLRIVARLSILLVVMPLLAACNLNTVVPAEATAESTEAGVIPTLTLPPTLTPTNQVAALAPTPTSSFGSGQGASNSGSDCASTPAEWSAYVVRPGDTLSRIASSNNTTTTELTQANCLGRPDQIFAGQTIYIPGPGLQVAEAGQAAVNATVAASGGQTSSTALNQPINFYLVIPDDNGQTGTAYGCGDSIIPHPSQQVTTGSVEADIQTAINALLAITTATYGENNYQNALHNADLTLAEVAISSDTARIDLNGTLRSVGACWDARVTGQLLFTVFQYGEINNALIRVNGENLKQMLDATGNVRGSEPYHRADFPL
jgi:LysM repeat protein